MKSKGWAAWVLACCCHWAVAATAPPAAPLAHKDVGEVFSQVPAPWRDYLLRARAAEEIADPLQRCLAFPDLPDNQWPAGFAQAHCRSHFNAITLSMDDVRVYLDNGDLAGLHARLDAMQARHWAKGSDQAEDIHYFFDDLRADPDNDVLTARWLALAPADAYAVLARATYLKSAAWKARGSKFAAEVPAEAWQQAHDYARQAMPLYRRAAGLDPQLIPAYEGALNLAMLGSDSSVQAWAQREAAQRDPACPMMAKATLIALKPRWGGSWPIMAAWQERLAGYLGERPLLALYLTASQADEGERRLADKLDDAHTLELLEAAIRGGGGEKEFRDAAKAALRTQRESWKAHAYALQSERFQPGNPWGSQLLAEGLETSDPDWARLIISRALAFEPDNATSHFLLGRALARMGERAEAQRAYERSLGEARLEPRAMKEIAMMWLYPRDPDAPAEPGRADPFVRRLLQAQPQDGMAWIMRLDVQLLQRQSIPEEIVDNVVKYADRTDPWQAERAESLEQMIKKAGSKR
jgi:tetratricopeptide (TPR) repeat protein